jgi:hypothetical protein
MPLLQPVLLGAAAVAAWLVGKHLVHRHSRSANLLTKPRFIHTIRTSSTNSSLASSNTQAAAFELEVVLLPLSSTDAEAVLSEASSFCTAHVVGLDCEWQPEQKKRERCHGGQQQGQQQQLQQHSPVSLLQLCWSEGTSSSSSSSRCYLAQLLHMDGVPSQLRCMLENPLVVKVGQEAGTPLLLFLLS